MSKRRPPVNPVPQKETFDCGPAAVSTFLLIIGREDLLKKDLYQRLGTIVEVGTPVEKIVRFLREEGVNFEERKGATLADLEERVTNDRVCLVDYQAWGTKKEKEQLLCGHYSVAFDVDEKFVWLFDPSIEKEEVPGQGVGVVKVKKEDFDKWWIDKEATGEVYDHWMAAAI